MRDSCISTSRNAASNSCHLLAAVTCMPHQQLYRDYSTNVSKCYAVVTAFTEHYCCSARTCAKSLQALAAHVSASTVHTGIARAIAVVHYKLITRRNCSDTTSEIHCDCRCCALSSCVLQWSMLCYLAITHHSAHRL
jgi:hypothetical protein